VPRSELEPASAATVPGASEHPLNRHERRALAAMQRD